MSTIHSRIAGAALLALCSASALAATPGAFDSSWGFGGGKAQLPFDLGVLKRDTATAAVQGSDGSFYIAGTVTGADNLDHIGIAKLSPDGKILTGFSGDSRNVSLLANVVATGIALSPDENRVYVSGYTTANAPDYDMVVCQFSANNGTNVVFPDSGTNSSCVSPSSFPGDQDIARDVVVQPDGKIVVAGTVGRTSPSNTYAAFARFEAGGNVDSTFGNVLGKPGLALVRDTDAYARHVVRAVALTSDGKIVGVGDTVRVNTTDLAGLVVRIDGAPNSQADAEELAVQRDNSPDRDTVFNDVIAVADPDAEDDALLVAGSVELSANKASGFLGKIRSDLGALDIGGFGEDNGFTAVTPTVDTLAFRSIALQDSGKILALGTRVYDDFPYTFVDVMRFDADGMRDGQFGLGQVLNAGHTVIDFGTDAGFNAPAGLAVRGNEGAYIAAHAFKTDQNNDFFAAKLRLDVLFADGFED
ncbi:hypothetical protein [Chiayiivirga flava]|uniref:Putative delta-60 repeat protein n=1 Tax=Chiayiivirga flava TaxID=659595 RepID=A0A7W8G0A9_9GAMM|nr:hypothetical protein [Chiayiivirga flava]MBB5208074.1 putative delta-60 repeat protein [Chiayiivirga flava]